MVNGGYRSQSGLSFRENRPKVKPRMQKRRPMNVEKYEALKNEVDKLLEMVLPAKLSTQSGYVIWY